MANEYLTAEIVSTDQSEDPKVILIDAADQEVKQLVSEVATAVPGSKPADFEVMNGALIPDEALINPGVNSRNQ